MTIRIYPFTREVLFDQIKKESGSEARKKSGADLEYFFAYLKHLNCQTIIIESGYIDGGYLEDYARYYSRCFGDYRKTTARFHFFENAIECPDLSKLTSGLSLTDSVLKYLGFIVIKPLQDRYIGRTCLKVYDEEIAGRERKYPIKRPYKVGLLGHIFTVDSIAYQEQDAEVAACATIAVWTALHACKKEYSVARIPSPYEITKIAVNGKPSHDKNATSRHFPNDGLNIPQLQQVFEKLGFDLLTDGVEHTREKDYKKYDTSSKAYINQTAYAYLSIGIPVIAVGSRKMEAGGDEEFHAVTIVGYSLGDSKPSIDNIPFGWATDRIEKLYAHDDGMGPFARFEWGDSHKGALSAPVETRQSLISYKGEAEAIFPKDSATFSPQILLAPLNRKIRTSIWPIRAEINKLKLIITRGSNAEKTKIDSNKLRSFEWRLALNEVNDFRKKLVDRSESFKDCEDLAGVWLQVSMPKYIWIAELYDNELCEAILYLVYDATALNQNFKPLGMLATNNEHCALICKMVRDYVNASVDMDDFGLGRCISEHSKTTLLNC